ncbi:MAG: NAD(P)-dependent oxidoreductase [Bacteroidota bacterium]|nr:NAD(P)-dependent oxidoreductase [Bacteroidota bacterium]
MKPIKIAVLKETKTPPDRRVVLTPVQVMKVKAQFPHVDVVIQPSELRCYKDEEYERLEITMQEDVSDCDILIGVKEAKINTLLMGKKYMFFSHTHKKQDYNRPLLNAFIDKKIQIIDHECLTDNHGIRLVAFGRWAGIVGAYNGLIAYGKRTGNYDLPRAKDCFNMQQMLQEVEHVQLPPNFKILITGGGRVANGALETLEPLYLNKVSPEDFLTKTFDEPVLCQIDANQYVELKEGGWKDFPHFFDNPSDYKSTFKRLSKVADMWIACHFHDPNSPAFLKPEDYREPDFNIKVIADVSCDIAGPIPSTLRASTITDPFYGYDPVKEKEANPWNKKNISVMAVDNLPGELPRDASEAFGERLIDVVFPYIFDSDNPDNEVVMRASITKDGKLTRDYTYLHDFLEGKE